MKDLQQYGAEAIVQSVQQEEKWLQQLKNCENQVEDLKTQLEVAAQNASPENGKRISHFENLFSHYQVEIKNFKHNVRLNIQNLNTIVAEHPEKYDNYLNDLEHHQQSLSDFFNYMDEARDEFHTFLTHSGMNATA